MFYSRDWIGRVIRRRFQIVSGAKNYLVNNTPLRWQFSNFLLQSWSTFAQIWRSLLLWVSFMYCVVCAIISSRLLLNFNVKVVTAWHRSTFLPVFAFWPCVLSPHFYNKKILLSTCATNSLVENENVKIILIKFCGWARYCCHFVYRVTLPQSTSSKAIVALPRLWIRPYFVWL